MTWRPTPYPPGTPKEKLAALRKHSTPITGSGMSEDQAMAIYRDSDAESIAIVRDWFIFENYFDHFEWPPVPDYSVVKPFKMFIGHIIADRKCRHLGLSYVTTYMRFFERKCIFTTANSTYLLLGEGHMVNDYSAVLNEPNSSCRTISF
jgi:hypothetical protein